MASVTPEQSEQVREWLSRRGALRCKVCDLGNLLAPTVIVTLPGAEDKPLVPLTCGHCASVVLFDLLVMGIM